MSRPTESGVYIMDAVAERDQDPAVRVGDKSDQPIQFVINEDLRFIVHADTEGMGVVITMSTNLAGEMGIFPAVSNRILVQYVEVELT